MDVGATQGVFSAIATPMLGPAASIVAIEPQPRLADYIKQTLQVSKAQHWEVLRVEVSDRPGVMDLVVPGENQSEAHLRVTNSIAESMV